MAKWAASLIERRDYCRLYRLLQGLRNLLTLYEQRMFGDSFLLFRQRTARRQLRRRRRSGIELRPRRAKIKRAGENRRNARRMPDRKNSRGSDPGCPVHFVNTSYVPDPANWRTISKFWENVNRATSRSPGHIPRAKFFRVR